MQRVALAVVCVALACRGRRVRSAEGQVLAEVDQWAARQFQRGACDPATALGALLLATSPGASYASAGPGVRLAANSPCRAMPRSVVLDGQRRLSQRASALRMGDDARSEAEVLERYLQLAVVLPEQASLPDEQVQLLVSKAEEQAAPVKFDEERISGDWRLVWQQNTKSATNSQKAAASLPQYSNFITDEKGKKVFRNIVQLSKKRLSVVADVEYDAPSPENESPGNRLLSTIGDSSFQAKLGQRFGWKPLRIPLPIKGKGWLDVTYLSDNMRITRGNRGSVFVHLRPELLTREAAEALPK
mmetsp:Transcript_158752/g.280450  ORF Transcript_158752/g.280450 Transcript_158752/m.280450 type:complete len:302 (-) Transcript_158752:73-978(-)